MIKVSKSLRSQEKVMEKITPISILMIPTLDRLKSLSLTNQQRFRKTLAMTLLVEFKKKYL